MEEFQKNRDDLTKEGLLYDFNAPFFENFNTLLKTIDLPNLVQSGMNENCAYVDNTNGTKNGYLSYIVVVDCENAIYSCSVKDNSKNVFNSVMVWDNNENIYMGCGILKSFNVFYSRYITDSSNIRLCTNMIGCHDCIFCNWLENKSYCIENQQYTKAIYLQKKEDILKNKNLFEQVYKSKIPTPQNYASTNVSNGVFVIKSQDIERGSYVYQTKGGRNIIMAGGKEWDEEVYNCLSIWSPSAHDFYNCIDTGTYSHTCYNTAMIVTSSNIYYSYFMESCSFCLGCIGLKNKTFCIFNKEYSKEERFDLANKIFASMEKDGTLGDFFPGGMTPFYFNDTIAYALDDSFTREEVAKDGYLRRDAAIATDIPAGSDVIKVKDLKNYQWFDAEGKWMISPDILKKVIEDPQWNHYRIVKMEYDFLVKYCLPLPELHRLERIKLGFKFK